MLQHLCAECSDHFRALWATLASWNIPYEVDGRIVRGLDYYTKTAYEIVSTDLGSQDALAGGGRYDLLAEQLGGKATPAVGFAAGIERLLMVMERQKIDIADPVHPFVFIAGADEKGKLWASEKCMELRRAGIGCEIDLLDRSLKSQMKEADRQRSTYVLVIGERELEAGSLSLKNMKSGAQASVTKEKFAGDILKLRDDEKGKTG
jgi:histidyl-tRNA synthetase